MKELGAMVQAELVVHDGCPVTTWMMGNVTCKPDRNDNIFPRKEHPANKIDGALAAMFAMHRYLADYGRACVYEERGLIAI